MSYKRTLLFSREVVSDSLRPHELQHTSLPCHSLCPWVCSNSCPLSLWCYLTISSPVALFSFCLQFFPASGSFPKSWLFTSGSQSIRSSALASVLPMNIHSWFPLGLIGLISLLSKGLWRVFSSTTIRKHQFLMAQPSLWSNSPIYVTTGKTIALTRWTFAGKVIISLSLLINYLGFSMAPQSSTFAWKIPWTEEPGRL